LTAYAQRAAFIGAGVGLEALGLTLLTRGYTSARGRPQ